MADLIAVTWALRWVLAALAFLTFTAFAVTHAEETR